MSEGLLTEGLSSPEPMAPPAATPNPAPADPPKDVVRETLENVAPSEGRFSLNSFADESLRSSPSLAKFADKDGVIDVEMLSKSYVHADQMIGRDKIVVPEGEDDWDEVYNKLGRPETPDAYELERPELPEGVDAQYSEDEEKHFRVTAHQLGLNQKQASEAYKALVSQRLEQVGEWSKVRTQAREEAINTLRREQGENFPAYMNQAKAALREFADPVYLKHLEDTGQDNDPQTIRMWAKVGQAMMGDRKLEGPSSQPTPADLDREIADYVEKYGRAIDDPDHPDFKKHNAHLKGLYERRYQDDAA